MLIVSVLAVTLLIDNQSQRCTSIAYHSFRCQRIVGQRADGKAYTQAE